MNKKLYRDEYHKVLGGVCSGLADYFDMDVTVIRLLFAFTVIVMGVGIIPYIVLWIVLPKKGYLYNQFSNPTVDYTVPPQQPAEGQFTAGSNPFANNPYGANSFNEVPPLKYPQKQKSNAGIIVGVVLIVIGAAVLIDEYDLIPDFDFGRLWPIVLVLVGASLIVTGQQKKPWHHENWSDATSTETKTEPTEPQEPLV
jgi:phage shock protein C